MKNSILLAALMLALCAFVGMMKVKTDVQTMDTQRSKLVNQRAELRETKRVLEAEWALLASPERLQQIADRAGKVYLNGSALVQVRLWPLVASSPTALVPMAGQTGGAVVSVAVGPVVSPSDRGVVSPTIL